MSFEIRRTDNVGGLFLDLVSQQDGRVSINNPPVRLAVKRDHERAHNSAELVFRRLAPVEPPERAVEGEERQAEDARQTRT